METFDAQVDLQGRIVIPAKIRRKLALKPYDHVRIKDLTKLRLIEEANPGEAAE